MTDTHSCRLLSDADCPYKAAYPLQITVNQYRFAICNACQQRSVVWMVFNSVVSPADPCHYCDVCFNMIHYNADGSKVCDFQAYRYTDSDFIASADI